MNANMISLIDSNMHGHVFEWTHCLNNKLGTQTGCDSAFHISINADRSLGFRCLPTHKMVTCLKMM